MFIKNGQIVRPGLAHLLHNLTHMSLNLRIWAATSIVNCVQLLVCVMDSFASGGKITNYAIFGATLFGFLINVLPLVHLAHVRAQAAGQGPERRAGNCRRRPVGQFRNGQHG